MKTRPADVEENLDALEPAADELEALAPLDRRCILASYGALARTPTRETVPQVRLLLTVTRRPRL